MSEQYDEHEQGERVKQWLLKNGSNILTGFLLVIALIAGWQWWQTKQVSKNQEAANQYHTFTQAIDKKDVLKADALGQAIIKNYQKSDYAVLAALRLAKFQQDLGKPDDASKALQQALNVARDAHFTELVKLRQATLLMTRAKLKEANAALAAFKPVAYPASYAELQGDIALAQGQRAQAVTFYQSALKLLETSTNSRPLIEMKLTEAGGSPTQATEIH